MKTVCVIDSQGFFAGTDRAFESPREAGVYMIPAGCVDIDPPAIVEGRRPKFDEAGHQWVQVEAAPVVVETGDGADLSGSVAVKYLLDQKAQQAGYDSILAAISYADEPAVPAYQADGRKFRAWRSVVWSWFYADEKLEAESLAELSGMMPKFEA